jgi:tripartite-type tricarboxylate transporter receptor subunit TctC
VFAETEYILVANPNLSIFTLQDLIAFARKNPGKIIFASAGIGSAPH